MSVRQLDAQSPGGKRRAVNVSVDADLVAAARELGVPLSPTFEEALRVKVAEARRERWREENRAGIEEFNSRVERSGAFSDGHRRF